MEAAKAAQDKELANAMAEFKSSEDTLSKLQGNLKDPDLMPSAAAASIAPSLASTA